jgi:Malic enzyme, NAD binding domain
MAERAIVFAMANPTPEVPPEAIEATVEVVATGRSDYPNQINNALAFPGVFRGALDVRAREINEGMKVAAAHAIAGTIADTELSADYVVPSVFTAPSLPRSPLPWPRPPRRQALRAGVARRPTPELRVGPCRSVCAYGHRLIRLLAASAGLRDGFAEVSAPRSLAPNRSGHGSQAAVPALRSRDRQLPM